MITPYIRSSYRQTSKAWLNENIININNFGGGMNNVEADNVINDNEASDTKNMRFVSATLMEKRHGCTEIEDYDALDDKIVWIDEYKPMLGESVLIRATEDELYADDTKIADLEGRIRGVTFYGKYYFVDGDSLRVYDGTNVLKIVTEPLGYLSEKYTHSAGNTGIMTFEDLPVQLAANDRVFILASSAYADGNLWGTVTSINANQKKVTITFDESLAAFYIDKGQPIFFYTPLSVQYYEGVTQKDLVKGITWYEPCINQLADADAGAGYIPKNPKLIISHKNRLFIAGDEDQPHTVYFSWTGSEYYFPCYHNVGIKPNGEPIIDLVVFDNALIIGREKDMYVLYGSSVYEDSGDTFYIKQMDVSAGFMCSDCGALLNNYYIFLGSDGIFYKLNTPTTLVEYLMTKPLPRKIDIYKEPFNLDNQDKLDVSTVAFYNQIYFNVADDLIIVYSYDNMAWTYYTGMDSSALYSDGVNLYIGNTDGKLLNYEYLTDCYSDCGEAIECVYASKRFDLNAPATYKYFKSFMLTSHAWENVISTISAKFESDYYDMEFETPPVYSSNMTRFGGKMIIDPIGEVVEYDTEQEQEEAETYPASFWEIDVFNNRNLFKSRWTKLDVRSRTLKVYLSNNVVDEAMRVYGYSLLLSSRDVR